MVKKTIQQIMKENDFLGLSTDQLNVMLNEHFFYFIKRHVVILEEEKISVCGKNPEVRTEIEEDGKNRKIIYKIIFSKNLEKLDKLENN